MSVVLIVSGILYICQPAIENIDSRVVGMEFEAQFDQRIFFHEGFLDSDRFLAWYGLRGRKLRFVVGIEEVGMHRLTS